MLVYLLSPSHSSLQTNSRKIRMDFIGPLAIKDMLDRNHAILQTLDGKHINGIFHVARLKVAWIRTENGVTNNIKETQCSQPVTVTDEKGQTGKQIPDLSFNYTCIGHPIELGKYKQTATENEDMASLSILPTQIREHHVFRAMLPIEDTCTLDIKKARVKNGSLQLLIMTPMNGHDIWLDTSQHPNLKLWTDSLESDTSFRICGSKKRFVKCFLGN
jgi:hypothetical protein